MKIVRILIYMWDNNNSKDLLEFYYGLDVVLSIL